jgi:WD40 repeat protein
MESKSICVTCKESYEISAYQSSSLNDIYCNKCLNSSLSKSSPMPETSSSDFEQAPSQVPTKFHILTDFLVSYKSKLAEFRAKLEETRDHLIQCLDESILQSVQVCQKIETEVNEKLVYLEQHSFSSKDEEDDLLSSTADVESFLSNIPQYFEILEDEAVKTLSHMIHISKTHFPQKASSNEQTFHSDNQADYIEFLKKRLKEYERKNNIKNDMILKLQKQTQELLAQLKAHHIDINQINRPAKKMKSSGILLKSNMSPKEDHIADIISFNTSYIHEFAKIRGHLNAVNAIAVTSDCKFIVSGSSDCNVKIWKFPENVEDAVLTGHAAYISSIVITKDDALIISGSGDCTIRIWDMKTRQIFNILEGHLSFVLCLGLSDNGRLLGSGSWDASIRIWYIASSSLISAHQLHLGPVNSICFSHDSNLLASASSDHTVSIWDIAKRKQETLEGHTDVVRSVLFTKSGKYVISCSDDKSIIVWSMHKKRMKCNLLGHSNNVRDFCLTADESYLVSASGDETIRVWSMKDYKQEKVLKGHSLSVLCVKITPDDGYIISGSVDKSIRIWSLKDI